MTLNGVGPLLVVAGTGLLLLARPSKHGWGRVASLPWQVYRIAIDPRLRRNHALEHATLHVMAQRFGPLGVDGVAVPAGFVLRGWINPQQIAVGAAEGRHRLRQGEAALALHPRCGTSLGTAELLVWLALAAVLSFTGQLSLVAAPLVVGLAWLAGPLAGLLVQRYLTTSTDVGGLAIRGITVRPLPAPARAVAARGGLPPQDAFWGEAVVLIQHHSRREERP